jgi:hypothetical protein
MSQNIPIYIPTYISDQSYNPARVQPRLLYYNGQVDCQQYYLVDGDDIAKEINQFPYFDNYSVVSGSQFPTTSSKSLLFFNEQAVYGSTPTGSLFSEYWSNYVNLLYNPRTRLINASAIIPLADYFQMELNDIVDFRGNYYHLRAINDYNLSNGECKIQLLGPILPDALNLPDRLFEHCLGYDATDCEKACFYVCDCDDSCPTSSFTFSTVDESAFSFDVAQASSFELTLPIKVINPNPIVDPFYPTQFTASWGDGTQTFVSSSNQIVSHTYASGSYTVELRGQCCQFGTGAAGQLAATNSLNKVLTKINQWGSMNFRVFGIPVFLNPLQFLPKLTSIPDGGPGLVSLRNNFAMFRGNSLNNPGITEIPPNLFKYCHNLGTWGNNADQFSLNPSLTSIPERLFYYCPNNAYYSSAFYGCINIKELPNEFFPPTPNALTNFNFINMNSIFKRCYALTGIPPNFFDPITGSSGANAINAFSMIAGGGLFNGLTGSLDGNAPELWNTPSSSNWDNAPYSTTGFFEDCIKLDNFASIPASWK